jgi:hypothetical protein
LIYYILSGTFSSMMAGRIQIPVIVTLILASAPASSMPIETNSDIHLNWDNTLQGTLIGQPGTERFGPAGRCSPMSGLTAREAELFACVPRSGLTSSRVDWWSHLTASYQDFGFDVTSTAWYDFSYDSWKTRASSAPGIPLTSYFTSRGNDPDGYIELLDAFLYGTTSLGADQPLSFRIGREVSPWGESLYFVHNGIAGGQAPINAYQNPTNGYSQASETFLPVGQASFNWQPANGLTVLGYYQFEWRRDRINPYDPYNSTLTILGGDDLNDDTRQIVLPSGAGTAPIVFNRTKSLLPGSTDQFGLGLRWRADDFDWGLYGVSFNAKTPEFYFRPPTVAGSNFGTFNLVFPKEIESVGVSVSGPLGDASFGAELSARTRMPLVNAGIVLPAGDAAADNNVHPRYPIGDTLQGQFSWLYTTPPLPGIPGGASWSGEVAANDLLSATENAARLVPGRTHAAAALRTVFEPQFYQIRPRLDLSVPIGLGYNFLGLSEVDSTMNRGTADLSVGAALTFDRSWKFTLSGTHYFGVTENAFLPTKPSGFREPLNNGDFVSLSVARSF